MKLCRCQGIEFISAVVYTVINGEDRFYFGPVARLQN